MGDLLPPFLFVLFLWWAGTGGVLLLVTRLPAGPALAGASVLGLLGLAGAWVARGEEGAAGAYLGFVAGMAVWAANEASFLMGAVTGPRREPAPAGVTGFARFRAAAATLMHHELALAATILLLAGLSWGAPNQAAALMFVSLFLMRLSAKLNVFLGVPNWSDEMLPRRLAYLRTYFRTRPAGPLMPLSLLAIGAAAYWFGSAALTAAGPGGAAQAGLVCALLALGALEHLLMIIPVRDSALWRWAAPKPSQKPIAATAAND